MYICACMNCGNSTYTIERWRQTVCVKHGVFHETLGCDCDRPFKLFTFPLETKDPDGRRRWTKQVNRKNKTEGGLCVKSWVPAKYSRICSKHFVEGQPTDKHPDPTLCLGYETKPAALKRTPPPNRTIQQQPGPSKKVKLTLNADHTGYVFTCECQTNCNCPGCLSKHNTILALQIENDILRKQLEEIKSKKSTDL